MQAKNNFLSNVEVLSREQMNKVKGGKEVEVIINGKKYIIIVPD